MIEAAGDWDAWASNLLGGLVGGLLGAVTVLGGILWSKNIAKDHEDAVGRRAAADELLVQVANLRDLALRSNRVETGELDLWRLRNQLYLSRSRLDNRTCLNVSYQFYWLCEAWRNWHRSHPIAEGEVRSPEVRDQLERYEVRSTPWVTP